MVLVIARRRSYFEFCLCPVSSTDWFSTRLVFNFQPIFRCTKEEVHIKSCIKPVVLPLISSLLALSKDTPMPEQSQWELEPLEHFDSTQVIIADWTSTIGAAAGKLPENADYLQFRSGQVGGCA